MKDPLLIAALVLTGFCGVAALGTAVYAAHVPGNGHTELLDQVFKMMLFIFSVGAMAVLFKVLG